MEQPTRKGFRSGVQTEFSLLAHVKPGEAKALRDFFSGGSNHAASQRAIQEIGTLHESRFVLFDNDTRLMFCSSFDGSWDKYIDDFGTTFIAHVFDAVFSHCEGYPAGGITDPGIKDWFMSIAQEALSFTSAYPDATVKQILKALTVDKAFEEVLDAPAAEQALQDPALKPLLELAAG